MNIGWEEELRKNLMAEITALDFPAETEERIRTEIHRQIRKRRMVMKLNRKHTGVVLAAALILVGAVTAIGAGKVAFYSSGHSVNDEITDIHALEERAKGELGKSIYCPETLADGVSFSRGIVMDVDAWDEENNKVGTFPEMCAYYQDGAGGRFNLSISRPIEASVYEKKDQVEVYQDIQLYGAVDQYLFLPPEEKPSAEDEQLEAAGELFISYGSSEVERKTFTSVSWDRGELHYLLHTYEDISLNQLMEWAKQIVDHEIK